MVALRYVWGVIIDQVLLVNCYICTFKQERMNHHIFTLTEDNEFITLDKLLKLMRVVGSGGEAHAVIQDGMVQVNGAVEMQKRKKMRVGDKAEFNGQSIEVKA